VEDIKEIGEVKWCLPGFLLKQKDCGEEIHILEVVGLLIEKIDEMAKPLMNYRKGGKMNILRVRLQERQ